MLLMMAGSLVVAFIFIVGKLTGNYGDWFTFGVGCAALVLCISLCVANRHWFTFG